MKMIVCTDGSQHSQKTLERASIIAKETNPEEVAVLHVYIPLFSDIPFGCSPHKVKEYKELIRQQKEDEEKILLDAVTFFEKKNIKATAIFEEGDPKKNPAETILRIASKKGFDTIVIGSKGRSLLGSNFQRFLGSVSRAVIQEVNNNSNCDVIVVN